MSLRLKAQTKWRWGVATYLFLLGMGAGAYVTGVIADFSGAGWTSLARIGIALGFPCMAIAGLVKIAQLGRPQVAWRAFLKPGTSWIARGSLMLLGFLAISFLHLVLWIWPAPGVLGEAEGARQVIGVVGGIFALGLMFYSGVLLAAAKPIAFWSTAMLPVLFFVSALLTGMMAVVFFSLLAGVDFLGPVAEVFRVVAVLLIFKALILTFYLQSTRRVPESRASARRVIAGPLAPLFWLGVVVLGLAVPLFLGLLDLLGTYGTGPGTVAVISCLCGALGGLFLRQVVLAGGIHAPLRAGRFEVGLPIV